MKEICRFSLICLIIINSFDGVFSILGSLFGIASKKCPISIFKSSNIKCIKYVEKTFYLSGKYKDKFVEFNTLAKNCNTTISVFDYSWIQPCSQLTAVFDIE